MSKIHSALTDADGLHKPKGFDAASNDTALIKNSSGVLEYRSLSLLGATGPAGPSGPPLPSVSVASIASPIAELASLSGSSQGDLLVVYDINSASANEVTVYSWDSEVVAANVPYIVTGSGGTWIAVAGKYQNQSINVPTGVLIDGRDVSVDGTKLDGIELGATADTGSGVAPPDVAASGAAGANTNVYANANHTHGHGNQSGGALHANATTSVAGFMSAADKTLLDNSLSDPLAKMTLIDDFPTVAAGTGQVGALGWVSDAAGTAALVIRKNGISGHPGIITLRPGTVATGRACISLGGDGTNFLIAGDGQIENTWVVRSAQSLAAFEMMVIGLGDTANAVGDQINGIYFQLLTGDLNWFLVTSTASTRTRVDTGIPYVANDWFKLKLTVNAAGTSVQANINGSDVGTAITTNIPASAISPLAKVDGIAGGTASDTDFDYFSLIKTLTTSR